MQTQYLDQLNILLVEDNPGDARLVEELLKEAPELGEWAPDSPAPRLHVARSLREAREKIGELAFDVTLLDLGLPDSQGLETLGRMLDLVDGCPIVVLTVEN